MALLSESAERSFSSRTIRYSLRHSTRGITQAEEFIGLRIVSASQSPKRHFRQRWRVFDRSSGGYESVHSAPFAQPVPAGKHSISERLYESSDKWCFLRASHQIDLKSVRGIGISEDNAQLVFAGPGRPAIGRFFGSFIRFLNLQL